MAVIAVTGLRIEAEIARKAGFSVVCAGGFPAHSAAALAQAIGGGAPSGLISFGIAGGLAPGLAPGTLVLAGAVVAADGTRHPVEAAWRARVGERLDAVEGDIFGGPAIVAAATAKAALHTRTGAVAVDLESAVVAEAASRTGLPFLVIRAIADPAERDLPAAARIRLKPDGRPDLRAIAVSVLLKPGQIPALIQLAGDTRSALRALSRAVAAAVALPCPGAACTGRSREADSARQG
jgi:adenosylhomocysteine nucleosidase